MLEFNLGSRNSVSEGIVDHVRSLPQATPKCQGSDPVDDVIQFDGIVGVSMNESILEACVAAPR